MLNWLFRTSRQLKTLGDIRWIDRETERFFTQDLEGLKTETQEIVKMANESKKRSQLAAQYFQGLREIEQNKLASQAEGYGALAQVQQSRRRVQDIKSKLLEAARG